MTRDSQFGLVYSPYLQTYRVSRFPAYTNPNYTPSELLAIDIAKARLTRVERKARITSIAIGVIGFAFVAYLLFATWL